MPGFNGRGPNGQGPLTGGGRGRCGANLGNTQGLGMAWGTPQAYGQGRGRGMGPCGGGRANGRGRGRGMGYGMGQGYGQAYGQGYGQGYAPTSQDLQAEAEELRRRLAQVEARLDSPGPDEQ